MTTNQSKCAHLPCNLRSTCRRKVLYPILQRCSLAGDRNRMRLPSPCLHEIKTDRDRPPPQAHWLMPIPALETLVRSHSGIRD
jgi:hypothetical protein